MGEFLSKCSRRDAGFVCHIDESLIPVVVKFSRGLFFVGEVFSS